MGRRVNPVLLAGVLAAGGFWALVELVYWFDHRPFVRDIRSDLAGEFGVPDEWVSTLLAIRGLPDGRRRLVYDWMDGRWVER